jgi:hypothetical protein
MRRGSGITRCAVFLAGLDAAAPTLHNITEARMSEHHERSGAGDPIRRYQEPAWDELAYGNGDLIESISAHIERHPVPVSR